MRPSSRAVALVLAIILAAAPTAVGKSDKSGKHASPHQEPAAALSDLVVHFAEFNGTLQEGSSNGIYASVENSGAPTASDFVVRFRIDSDFLSDLTMPAGFVGYGSPNAPQRWTATVGTHVLTVEIDATQTVPETDETNNVYTTTFVVQPGPPGPPDLRIQNGGFIDPVDQEGQSSRAWVTVENAGSATQVDSTIAFDVDGASIGTATVPAGYAGVQSFQSPQAWTATAGTHTLRITVDATDAIAEADESNNVFTQAVTVSGGSGGTSELRVQYGSWNGTAYDGVPIDAYASIENTGAPTATDSLVRFQVDGTWLGDATAPAGWTGIIAVSSPDRWTPTAGWHTLRADVDAGNAIPESNEADNGFQMDFYVDAADARPDLRVLGAYFTNGLETGTWSDVTATIENVGPPTTVDTYVAFYVDDGYLGSALVSAGFDDSSLVHSPDGWTMQEGTHTLRVVVDATGAQDEADESNNAYVSTFRVGVAPPAPREGIYHWAYFPGAPNGIETTTLTVPKDYHSVWYDLQCGAATVEVYLDGDLMATCAAGVRTATYPDTLTAGEHTFGVVYLGVGPGTLDVTGVPTT
jgi:subtilase family serine protease